jgi:hypothetical protein
VQHEVDALFCAIAEPLFCCAVCAAVQRAWDARDMNTQVTTPALRKQHSSTAASSRGGSGTSNLGRGPAAAAAVSDTAEWAAKQVQQQGCQAGGGACDVTASPVKVRPGVSLHSAFGDFGVCTNM